MKFYRFTFIAVSLILMVSINLISRQLTINTLLALCHGPYLPYVDSKVISYGCFLLIPMLLTWCIHRTFGRLDHADMTEEEISEVESASADFLPVFFGYVFVGISVSHISTLFITYLLLVVLCFCADIYLYNPMFHLLGYRFYFVKTGKNKVLILSKKEIKLREHVSFDKLGQINDFTFIDLKNK